MRTVKNRFLEAKTVRNIDDQIAKILPRFGNPTDRIDLADVRALLEQDRHYYRLKTIVSFEKP